MPETLRCFVQGPRPAWSDRYLGCDQVGRDYWLSGGHVYVQAETNDASYGCIPPPCAFVCVLSSFNRLRALRNARRAKAA